MIIGMADVKQVAVEQSGLSSKAVPSNSNVRRFPSVNIYMSGTSNGKKMRVFLLKGR